MAQIYQIGLDNWPGTARQPSRWRAPFIACDLCWLGETPLFVEEESWRGRQVLDRRGRRLGRVRDVLVEVRPSETAALSGRQGWGVRAAYFAVEARRGWRCWHRPRQVLVAAGRLQTDGDTLRADVDALELWPRLFGRTFGS